jgi:hypothetical protein
MDRKCGINTLTFMEMFSFNLELLANVYQQNIDNKTNSSFAVSISGTPVEIVARGGSFVGYIHIDPRIHRYYITTAKLADHSPPDFMKDLGYFNLLEGTLLGNRTDACKRTNLIATILEYIKFNDEVKPCDNIVETELYELVSNLKGHLVSVIGYAHKNKGHEQKRSFTLYSYPPASEFLLHNAFPMSITLYYEDGRNRSNTYDCAVPLRIKQIEES